ncbi:MAG: Holliday junction branch migration protein RuvA [Alphaproteobacteria bacterium]|nr:Holliday junction branch migration protein RuvA [Alphaproteobacteria bacterium]
MIGKLTGTLDQISGNTIILDVNGVGYVVMAGARTLGAIGRAGDKASLLIETIVREDAITLYGFADAAERQWFKTLTTVQGVGPKVCLSILSACTPDQLALAIGAKDVSMLTRADGVGKKLAERIVTELKDKTVAVPVVIPSGPSPEAKQKRAKPANDATSFTEDAVSALVNLGYGRSEAYQAVHSVLQKSEVKDLGALITQSLKEMAA